MTIEHIQKKKKKNVSVSSFYPSNTNVRMIRFLKVPGMIQGLSCIKFVPEIMRNWFLWFPERFSMYPETRGFRTLFSSDAYNCKNEKLRFQEIVPSNYFVYLMYCKCKVCPKSHKNALVWYLSQQKKKRGMEHKITIKS